PPVAARVIVTGEAYQPFAPGVPDTVAETCGSVGSVGGVVGGATIACVTTGLDDAAYVASPAKRARTYSFRGVFGRKAIVPEKAPFASVAGNCPICPSGYQV